MGVAELNSPRSIKLGWKEQKKDKGSKGLMGEETFTMSQADGTWRPYPGIVLKASRTHLTLVIVLHKKNKKIKSKAAASKQHDLFPESTGRYGS